MNARLLCALAGCLLLVAPVLPTGAQAPSQKRPKAKSSDKSDKSKRKKSRRPRGRGLEGARQVIYRKVGDVELKLYIFEPTRKVEVEDDRRPAIVFFFGGGWRSGSPRQFAEHCRYLAGRGMVAIAAEYRVYSRHKAKVADCIADAKAAIRWVRAHAPKLGVDRKRVAAGGGSAGGHLAAATAILKGFGASPGVGAQGGSDPSRPDALVLFNPALDLRPEARTLGYRTSRSAELVARLGATAAEVSPTVHLRHGAPPTILFHGKADTTVPYAQAEAFAAKMKKVGSRCELVGYDGAAHGFFNFGRGGNRAYIDTVRRMDGFLASLKFLKGEPTLQKPRDPKARGPLRGTIDRLVEARIEGPVAPGCTDAEFLRRVWLDLASSIPTAAAAREFLDDASPGKRARLVDRLLASPECASRLAIVFDVMLMERRPKKHIAPAAFREFLRTAFAENRPYNQLARQILSSDGSDKATRPAVRFLLDRDSDPSLLTRDIGRLFLGRDMQCAQCHDHPVIDDYHQADYYGLNAFLSGSFVFECQEVDYNGKKGTLTFPPGATEQVILVGIKGDKRDEPDETLFVELSNATGAVIADATGVGTIVDDDGKTLPAAKRPPATLGERAIDAGETRPRLTVNDWKLKERDGGTDGLPFTVRLSRPATGPVTVEYLTRNGSADDGANEPVTIAERAAGTVTFKSVFNSDTSHNAVPRLPEGLSITEPKLTKGEEYLVKPGGTARPVPKFSRRQALARLLTSGKSREFNRNITNRLWAVMMGRGLVHPLDLHHPANPPSHPALLEAMTEAFVAADFDVKWLLRELAMTRAYQRSSLPPAATVLRPPRQDGALPRYALGRLKPLSPEQLAWSLLEATGSVAVARASDPEAFEKDVAAIVGVFARPQADGSFQPTAQEALFLSNAKLLLRLIAPGQGRLTTTLLEIDNAGRLAEELYLAVLSRRPVPEEVVSVGRYLAGREDRAAAIGELVWALVTSTEFRFNH